MASSWARAPWWVVAAALVVGAGIGRLSAQPSPSRGVATATVAAITPSTSISRSGPTVPIEAEALALPSTNMTALPNVAGAASVNAGVSVHASARTRVSSDLAAERGLLDIARAALGRSDAATALEACDKHERRFPHGALTEEREALAIQALADSKRSSEARARAQRFRTEYPKSIFLAALLGAVESDP